MGVASINIKFFADLKQFSTEMQNAQRKIKKHGDELKKMGGTLTKNLTAPIVALGGFAVKTAADLETLQTSFESMTGSVENAKKLTEDLIKFTAATPFQLEGVGKATKQLLAFGVEQTKVLSVLKPLGDIAAGANVPLSDMAAIYGKVKAKGKAMTEEILQLSDRGIPIIDVLAQQLGVAKSEIFNMAKEGKITFPLITKAFDTMTNKGGIFANQMAKQSGTLAGMFSTLRDNIQLALGALGLAISETFNLKSVISGLIGFVQGLVEKFNNLPDAVKKLIIIGGAVAAMAGPLMVIVGTVLPALTAGFIALTGPVGLAVAAIAAIGAVIYTYWEPIKKTLVDVANYFIDLYNESTAFKVVAQGIVFQFKAIWSAAKFALSAIIDMLGLVWENFKTKFVGIGQLVKAVFTGEFSKIPEIVKNTFGQVSSNYADAFKNVSADFSSLMDEVQANAKTAVDNINSKNKIKFIASVVSVKDAAGGSDKTTTTTTVPTGGSGSGSGSGNIAFNAAPDNSMYEDEGGFADQLVNDEDLDKMAERYSQMTTMTQEFGQNIAAAMQEAAVGFLSGFGEILGGMMVGTASLKDLGKLALTTLADLAVSVGKMAIKFGVAMLGLQKILRNPLSVNPAIAIAAGVALVAVGSALKGSLASAASGGSSSASGISSAASLSSTTTSSVGTVGTASSYSSSGGASEVPYIVSTKLEGTDLVVALERQYKKDGRQS